MANSSGMTADIKELNDWNARTKEELEQVQAVLDRVSKVCSELDDDDTIYGWFKQVGNALAEEYLELSNTFRKCTELTKDVIDFIGKGIQGVGDLIKNFAKNFHR